MRRECERVSPTTVRAPRECAAAGERADTLENVLVCTLEDRAAGAADVTANAIFFFSLSLLCIAEKRLRFRGMHEWKSAVAALSSFFFFFFFTGFYGT